MIEEIIDIEWEFFQNTIHVEGRASCQDNKELFCLYRKSQFLTFSEELLESYLSDLKEYRTIGLNPIMLKYAYMMESNDPQGYQEIENQLPIIGEQQKEIIEEIVSMELEMMKEFVQAYPNISGASRNTYSSSDDQDNTSFETYLRGELKTYSGKTLYLYGKLILDTLHANENLVTKTREHTVLLYGYTSLEDAENKMN